LCETGNYHTFARLAAWRGYTRRLKIASFSDWHEDLWLFLAKRHGSDDFAEPATRWRNWKKDISAKLNDYEELKRLCNQIKRDRNECDCLDWHLHYRNQFGGLAPKLEAEMAFRLWSPVPMVWITPSLREDTVLAAMAARCPDKAPVAEAEERTECELLNFGRKKKMSPLLSPSTLITHLVLFGSLPDPLLPS